jgi:MFS family permease
MFSRRLKIGYFILEGLNSFSTVYYFYYLFFFMQKVFGFGNKANLTVAALSGGIAVLAAWWGGKFAQRFGYFKALKLGFVTMMLALAVGLQLESAPGQIIVMSLTVIGMCLTWPTLEALISEGEPAHKVQHMVGLYNVVWAGTAALANFTGGAMLDKLGPHSLFFVPIAILLSQLGLTLWLEAQALKGPKSVFENCRSRRKEALGAVEHPVKFEPPYVGSYDSQTHSKGFLRMAWLANPFAYIAINTVVAAMPSVASRLNLSITLAGFCCSVWCFSRLGAFFCLWFWDGWHYRFRWLLLSYLALAASFASILLVRNLAVVVLAQIVFGAAAGLIYYSSLFYSMHRSETKGEHGGIHEAAIGLGNFAGPAVGATALHFLPRSANSGAWAVTALLVLGLGGLVTVWQQAVRKSKAQSPKSKVQSPDPEFAKRMVASE